MARGYAAPRGLASWSSSSSAREMHHLSRTMQSWRRSDQRNLHLNAAHEPAKSGESLKELLVRLGTSEDGLSAAEARRRLATGRRLETPQRPCARSCWRSLESRRTRLLEFSSSPASRRRSSARSATRSSSEPSSSSAGRSISGNRFDRSVPRSACRRRSHPLRTCGATVCGSRSRAPRSYAVMWFGWPQAISFLQMPDSSNRLICTCNKRR
jgi:hypothetical protein